MKALRIIGLLIGLSLTAQAQVDVSELDQLPVFGDCSEIPDAKRCFGHNLNKAIEQNIVYPKKAMDEGLSGVVYVGFEINEKGEFVNVKIEKGIEQSLNKAALNCIESLKPCVSPGMKDGKAVAVKFTSPIKFALR